MNRFQRSIREWPLVAQSGRSTTAAFESAAEWKMTIAKADHEALCALATIEQNNETLKR
jgi:hypothetical protein